jgi:hypothetical protein
MDFFIFLIVHKQTSVVALLAQLNNNFLSQLIEMGCVDSIKHKDDAFSIVIKSKALKENRR